MHRVRPPHPVGVAVVVEVPARTHPIVPCPNMRFHVVQRKREPKLAKVPLHMLRHPVLVHPVQTHARTSFPLPTQAIVPPAFPLRFMLKKGPANTAKAKTASPHPRNTSSIIA